MQDLPYLNKSEGKQPSVQVQIFMVTLDPLNSRWKKMAILAYSVKKENKIQFLKSFFLYIVGRDMTNILKRLWLWLFGI